MELIPSLDDYLEEGREGRGGGQIRIGRGRSSTSENFMSRRGSEWERFEEIPQGRVSSVSVSGRHQISRSVLTTGVESTGTGGVETLTESEVSKSEEWEGVCVRERVESRGYVRQEREGLREKESMEVGESEDGFTVKTSSGMDR